MLNLYDTILIGIDPGLSDGCIAWRVPVKLTKEAAFSYHVCRLYREPEDMLEQLMDFKRTHFYIQVYIEKVGASFPGNAAASAAKLSRHMGHLDMALIACGFDVHYITSQKWMKQVVPDRPMPPKGVKRTDKQKAQDKAKRKEYIYKQMCMKYSPYLKTFKYNADALGILTCLIQDVELGEVKT